MKFTILPIAGLLVLTGCVQPGGLAAGGDGCAAPRTSFVGAGDPFVQTGTAARFTRPDFSRGARAEAPAPAPGADLAGALQRENAELESLQIAFDGLLYCRWIEARTVRADLAAGRTARPVAEARMAALRQRLRADLDRARAVLASLERQGEARNATIETLAPGTTAAATARRAGTAGRPRPVVASATVLLRLRPDAGAPEVGRIAAGESVAVRPAEAGFAAVEVRGQVRGYAPSGAFQIPERAAAAARGPDSPIRTLASTNIARRDNFAESVALAETSAVAGFELAT